MTEENENHMNLAAYLNECFKTRKSYLELLKNLGKQKSDK